MKKIQNFRKKVYKQLRADERDVIFCRVSAKRNNTNTIQTSVDKIPRDTSKRITDTINTIGHNAGATTATEPVPFLCALQYT